MNSICPRSTGIVSAAGLLALAACFHTGSASVSFAGCWQDGAPVDYIVSTAANAIIGDRGEGGRRMRALVDGPLEVDSIRARGRLVVDPSICSRLWRLLDPESRQARLAVVQIGRMYWVRLPSGYAAFDDSYRRLTTLVDL